VSGKTGEIFLVRICISTHPSYSH